MRVKYIAYPTTSKVWKIDDQAEGDYESYQYVTETVYSDEVDKWNDQPPLGASYHSLVKGDLQANFEKPAGSIMRPIVYAVPARNLFEGFGVGDIIELNLDVYLGHPVGEDTENAKVINFDTRQGTWQINFNIPANSFETLKIYDKFVTITKDYFNFRVMMLVRMLVPDTVVYTPEVSFNLAIFPMISGDTWYAMSHIVTWSLMHYAINSRALPDEVLWDIRYLYE